MYGKSAMAMFTVVLAIILGTVGASASDKLTDSATPTKPAGTQTGQTQPLAPTGSGFTYQGRLSSGGSSANGQFDLNFTLWDSALGGAQIGSTVSMANQAVSNGLFTVSLDFGPAAFQGSARWLEMSVRPAGVGSYTTLTPRQSLTPAPYAMSLMPGAVITGTLAGTMFSVTNNGSAGSSIFGTSSSTNPNDAGIYGKSLGANGNGVVGEASIGPSAYGVFGISSGGHAVHGHSNTGFGVYGFTLGSSNVAGVYGMSTDQSLGGVGVKGEANGGSSPIAVYGKTSSTYSSAIGVKGESPNGIGVKGESPNGIAMKAETTSGIAVYGSTTTGGVAVKGETNLGTAVSGNSQSGTAISGETNTGYGVYGHSTDSFGVMGASMNGAGMYGNSYYFTGVIGSTNTSGSYIAGVRGYSSATGGTGVIGESGSGSGAVGVWGMSTNGWAGYFSGKVHVNGTLSKAAGSFKIDHPVDPANKYLSHSFVESPDMMNIYNGEVTLDGKGEATVTMPAWFQALNQDFRYQLTAVGAPGPNLYIAQKITENTFRIAGGTQGMEVSWQVTGIRHDPYANAHRIPVEEDKSANERGYYLSPELYNQPASKQVTNAPFAAASEQHGK